MSTKTAKKIRFFLQSVHAILMHSHLKAWKHKFFISYYINTICLSATDRFSHKNVSSRCCLNEQSQWMSVMRLLGIYTRNWSLKQKCDQLETLAWSANLRREDVVCWSLDVYKKYCKLYECPRQCGHIPFNIANDMRAIFTTNREEIFAIP